MTANSVVSTDVHSAVAVVYRFFDSGGHLLYVGVTGTGVRRWVAHSMYQPWWLEVASATVTHCATWDEAVELERLAIRSEKPRYNVIHLRPHPPATKRSRGRGEGTVFLNKRTGRWCASISLGPEGYGRRPVRSFDTREEAEAGLAQLKAERFKWPHRTLRAPGWHQESDGSWTHIRRRKAGNSN